MPWLPANVTALDVELSRGHATTLSTTWTDTAGASVAPGTVSLWIGGDISPLDTTTGATEIVGSVASNVATFAITAQTSARQALRLERNGTMLTAGHLTTTTKGAVRSDLSQSIVVGDTASIAITVRASGIQETEGVVVIYAGSDLSFPRPDGIAQGSWYFDAGTDVGANGENVVHGEPGDDIFVYSS